MTLDELLTQAGAVDTPPADLITAIEPTLAAAARADITRRATVVRRRRMARFGTAGVGVAAAAAVVGVITLQPGRTTAPEAGPTSTVPVTPDFKTVAQVVNAAADATPDVDPTAAPYWKTVVRSDSFMTRPLPDGTYCNVAQHLVLTGWSGNDRPSVGFVTGDPMSHDNGKPVARPAAGSVIDGRAMSWRQINEGHWTHAQIVGMVTEPGMNDGDNGGRPPAPYYVFKDTAELLLASPASPAIRKQLWHHLASLRGVRLDGRAKDALGRQGWKLSYEGPTIGGHKYGDEAVIVDPESGLLLQNSVTFPEDSAPSMEVLVSAGPADTAPEPQPEWTPPPAPVSSTVPPIKRMTEQQMLEQARRQAAQPMPYPACPADIATRR